MACVSDRPNCGVERALNPLNEIVSLVTFIASLVGIIVAIYGLLGWIKISSSGVVLVNGIAVGAGFGAGLIAGFVAAVATFVLIAHYGADRCTQGTGESECLAGVVIGLENSFSSTWDELFPWRAMHDRVDIVVKSFYWQVLEASDAYVFCTAEEMPEKSEIARCYFYDRRVCAASQGAATGAAIGAVIGIVVAAFIAAALCVTIVLCVLGLILASAAASAIVFAGAAIGGQIAKGFSTDDDPSAEGQTIQVGSLVTVHGPIQNREDDSNANVVYWADSAQFHGTSMSPQPFTYCDINDELAEDGCRRVPVIE
ncbi:hypothetical protein OG824_27140 [Streptomyces prunicolor]|uniref:hypothetical protein n=1 Tax=Streptomyces prunicolor TaxID=67348 RepID=UPI0022538A18|nr:hypothetical protein [Streptomyces prunicolor]MCX5238883.1 hypothetical protein [Streptomyces prunicolor]